MMIPPAQYAYEKIRPLNRLSDVESRLKQLDLLTDLSAASELLLAAQHRKLGTLYSDILCAKCSLLIDPLIN